MNYYTYPWNKTSSLWGPNVGRDFSRRRMVATPTNATEGKSIVKSLSRSRKRLCTAMVLAAA